MYVCRAVRHLSGVRAGAAGKIVGYLGHVLLEEVALTIHPSLTTVRVWRKQDIVE